MIRISINPAYPAFAALPLEHLKKVSVGIGPRGMNTMFFNHSPYKPTFANIGDAGVNQAALMVSYVRPIEFSDESFGVFGNVKVTDFSSSRLANLLANYVDAEVLLVEKDGTPLTAAEILTYEP